MPSLTLTDFDDVDNAINKSHELFQGATPAQLLTSLTGGAIGYSKPHSLMNFYKKLYQNVTRISNPPKIGIPQTPLVTLGVYGDSVGNSAPAAMSEQLSYDLGDAGGFYSTVSVTGGASKHEDDNNGEFWINGVWYETNGTGTIEFLKSGGRPVCDEIKIFYVKRVGAGSFTVQIDDGTGYVDATGFVNIDASDTEAGAGVISISKDLGSYSVRVVGVSGDVEIIAATYQDFTNGGLCRFNMNVGGLPLSTFVQTPTAIVSTVFDSLDIDLMFIEFKDDVGFPAAFASFMTFREANMPTTDWCFIGTSPDSIDDGTEAVNNKIQSDYAIANDLIYFNGHDIYKDYAKLVQLGWNGDGTHLSEDANTYASNLLFRFLGFDYLLGFPSARQVKVKSGDTLNMESDAILKMSVDSDNYPSSEMSFNQDLSIKGGRKFLLKKNNGDVACSLPLDSGGRIEAPYYALIPPNAQSVGPALRPLGTAQYDGMYSSDLAPGNGSATAPFLCSEIRVGTKTDYVTLTKADIEALKALI